MTMVYDVPSTMVMGFCGILSVMARARSSVSSKESNSCDIAGFKGAECAGCKLYTAVTKQDEMHCMVHDDSH